MITKLYANASVKVPDNEPADAFPGSFHVILSTPELDRDGESIAAKAFEPLPDYVSFDIDHGMSVATTVGGGPATYEKNGTELHVRGTWSSLPRAQEVRTLVKEGHVRSTSVAFLGAKYETKDGVPTIVSAEILNGAFTPIPSNRGAAVIDAKAFAERVSTSDALDRPPMFKGHGMTARDLSAAIEKAVEEAHGGERVYTFLRDYTDEWAVFGIYSMQTGDRLLKQNYTVSGNVAKMSDDPTEVVAKVVYEPVENSTDTAPKSASADRPDSSAPSADADSALVSAKSALALASATLALSAR